jgi:hypothetical protein
MSKFQIGDRVRVIKSACHEEGNYSAKGAEGKITGFRNSNSFPIQTDIKYGSLPEGDIFYEDQLELIVEAKVCEKPVEKKHVYVEGDQVEIVAACSGTKVGDIRTLTIHNGVLTAMISIDTGCTCQHYWKLHKPAGVKMSKRDELKTRIEKLQGWTKEADDILQEFKSIHLHYAIYIPLDLSGHIFIVNRGDSNKHLQGFSFDNQCQKNSAFKSALMWLLDKAHPEEQLVGKEVRAEIEGKTYKVKVLESL